MLLRRAGGGLARACRSWNAFAANLRDPSLDSRGMGLHNISRARLPTLLLRGLPLIRTSALDTLTEPVLAPARTGRYSNRTSPLDEEPISANVADQRDDDGFRVACNSDRY